jgi:hypothetical protein
MSCDLTDASPKGQCHDTAPLRIVVSWGKSPIRGNLFAVDYQALCHGVDSAFERYATAVPLPGGRGAVGGRPDAGGGRL